MEHSVTIHAPIHDVFNRLTSASERVTWMRDVQSITYQNPDLEKTEGATFHQTQQEGKMKTTYEGQNIQVQEPYTFSYTLHGKPFKMKLVYALSDKGNYTIVTQHYQVTYHSLFAKMMGTLMSKLTKRLAADILNGLKTYCEQKQP